MEAIMRISIDTLVGLVIDKTPTWLLALLIAGGVFAPAFGLVVYVATGSISDSLICGLAVLIGIAGMEAIKMRRMRHLHQQQ